MRNACLAAVITISLAVSANAQTTAPSDDAAAIYMRAAKIVRDNDAKNINSPAASNVVYPEYPPFGDAWMKMEKEDYDISAQVRTLIRQATAINHAVWPVFDPAKGNKNVSYLNDCRNIANEIGDAALYQSLVLNDQPVAFASAGDVLHLSDLLGNQPGRRLIDDLVALGIQSLVSYRLIVITSGLTITTDPANTHDLPLATARQWIARLLDHPDAQTLVDHAIKEDTAAALHPPVQDRFLNRFLEMTRRNLTERDLAAMSLAAHVYQFEHHRWPASIDELKTELPRLPIDPWGDGKQTLGYALAKGTPPENMQRPLVYSRCMASDGLFYRTDVPEYAYYNADGSNKPANLQKHGGQFRDVARWAPPDDNPPGPTTMPLP